MTELFTIEESKSPRLKWMEAHQITVVKSGHTHIEDSGEGGDLYPFTIYSGKICDENGDLLYPPCGEGITEDEAFASLAKVLNVRLWNEV